MFKEVEQKTLTSVTNQLIIPATCVNGIHKQTFVMCWKNTQWWFPVYY